MHGQYDRIVSIEMLEAVGEGYWPRYFDAAARAPGPGRHRGAAGHHHRRGPLREPTAAAPTSSSATSSRAACCRRRPRLRGQAAGRRLHARRRGRLRRLLRAHAGRVAAPLPARPGRHRGRCGFDERFQRLWEYYLGYCEAGFRAGAIDVGQFRWSRAEATAGWRRRHHRPANSPDLRAAGLRAGDADDPALRLPADVLRRTPRDLGLAAVGAALLVARSLDVVTDPLIGIASDRLAEPLAAGGSPGSCAGALLAGVALVHCSSSPPTSAAAYLRVWAHRALPRLDLIAVPYAPGAPSSPPTTTSGARSPARARR